MGEKRICEQCGKEFDENSMERYDPSPLHPKWYCWDCWKKSQYEAVKSEIHRRKRLGKINESRKRNR